MDCGFWILDCRFWITKLPASLSNFLVDVGTSHFLVVIVLSSLITIAMTGLQSLWVDRFDRLTMVRGTSAILALSFMLLRLIFLLKAPGWLNYALFYLLSELNTHFNHPKEIMPEAAAACDRLLRHGIPVQNQSVLLKGINDDLDTMRSLLHELLKIRVRPYYPYHCNHVTGVSHFATSVEKGREIMRGLLGHTTGFAVPQYIVTTKLGKIPLWETQVHADEQGYWLENYQGETLRLAESDGY